MTINLWIVRLLPNAHYLATNDKHFNILKAIEFPKVQVINVLEFRQVLDTI